MTGRSGEMTDNEARALLGVGAEASLDEIRQAYRMRAKAAHPDLSGGGAERFQTIVAAYRVLAATRPAATGSAAPPAGRGRLEISPLMAWGGGRIERRAPDGRTLRISLPVGLRNGDLVRLGDETLEVEIRSRDGMTVRGDDLWITVAVSPQTLSEGGRAAVVTPIGRRILWVDRKAGARRLLRAPDLGLPPRGRHPQGSLFVRLAPKAGPLDSAARLLLMRFAAAWAA